MSFFLSDDRCSPTVVREHQQPSSVPLSPIFPRDDLSTSDRSFSAISSVFLSSFAREVSLFYSRWSADLTALLTEERGLYYVKAQTRKHAVKLEFGEQLQIYEVDVRHQGDRLHSRMYSRIFTVCFHDSD